MIQLKERSLDETLGLAVTVGSIPFWLIVIYYAYSQMMPRAQYGVVFLGGMLILYILEQYRDELDSDQVYERIVLFVSAVIVIITTLYIFFNYDALYLERSGYALEREYVLAIAFTLAMVYLTWRSFGLTFLAVLLIGIGYGLYGNLLPGVFGHGGVSGQRILRILVLEFSGFYGSLNRLIAAWVALFLLYAGLLRGYGAFDLIIRIAVRSAKYLDSGVAQTAVLSSAIIGSINGSQTANAGMTGSFTIPMMKDNGIKGETAGAIEAVASSIGQVLPPVMGAAAFIMASLVTGITYIDVIVAGVIPATIMLVSIAVAVHYVSIPQLDEPNLDAYREDPLSRAEITTESIKFGVPLAVLIYYLGILQYTVMSSALYTTVAMLIMGVSMPMVYSVYESTDVSSVKSDLLVALKETIDGARHGAIILAPIAIIIAAINGVVDILSATAVPTAISLALMDLSGGILLYAAILGVIICILLGLGMPTSAAYTIVALLIAPAFINQFLVPEMAAHYFVFYAAILAGITPPIATAVAVACGIAEADFWGTAYEAIKIAGPLFILPFAFIYNPEIVSGEFTQSNLLVGGITLVGAIAIIHGLNFQFRFNRVGRYAIRAVFFGTGVVTMAHPETTIQLSALGVAVFLFIVQNTRSVRRLSTATQ
jgi:TRAP transporter 4TM/12TM fusion protein